MDLKPKLRMKAEASRARMEAEYAKIPPEKVKLSNVPSYDDLGRLRRVGRWRAFAVYGKRCPFCLQGILWILREGKPYGREVPIEPMSWHGEERYWGKDGGPHIFHGRTCLGMRNVFLKNNNPQTRADFEI